MSDPAKALQLLAKTDQEMVTIPRDVLVRHLTATVDVEEAAEKVRIWKDRAWLAMTDAAGCLDEMGGEYRMLARRIRVLLAEKL